jgi:hypothetical protein
LHTRSVALRTPAGPVATHDWVLRPAATYLCLLELVLGSLDPLVPLLAEVGDLMLQALKGAGVQSTSMSALHWVSDN